MKDLMSYLQCSVRRCANNQNDLCVREEIRVDGAAAAGRGDTSCRSFALRPESYENAAAQAFGAEPETDIVCEAMHCVFNEECRCRAPSVDIGGGPAAHSTRDTQCCTFDSKKLI